jgi:hypothetical protein
MKRKTSGNLIFYFKEKQIVDWSLRRKSLRRESVDEVINFWRLDLKISLE